LLARPDLHFWHHSVAMATEYEGSCYDVTSLRHHGSTNTVP
jgi:hypothetical protein